MCMKFNKNFLTKIYKSIKNKLRRLVCVEKMKARGKFKKKINFKIITTAKQN